MESGGSPLSLIKTLTLPCPLTEVRSPRDQFICLPWGRLWFFDSRDCCRLADCLGVRCFEYSYLFFGLPHKIGGFYHYYNEEPLQRGTRPLGRELNKARPSMEGTLKVESCMQRSEQLCI